MLDEADLHLVEYILILNTMKFATGPLHDRLKFAIFVCSQLRLP
jgi:hypothetical protein